MLLPHKLSVTWNGEYPFQHLRIGYVSGLIALKSSLQIQCHYLRVRWQYSILLLLCYLLFLPKLLRKCGIHEARLCFRFDVYVCFWIGITFTALMSSAPVPTKFQSYGFVLVTKIYCWLSVNCRNLLQPPESCCCFYWFGDVNTVRGALSVFNVIVNTRLRYPQHKHLCYVRVADSAYVVVGFATSVCFWGVNP